MNDAIILEFKGGRFLGAENLLNLELNKNPNYETYFNLMICKINLMFDEGRTIDEVVFCFNKTIELVEKNKRDEILISTKEIVINIIEQLTNLYKELDKQRKKENRKKIVGSLFALGSVLSMGVSKVKTSSSNLSTTIGQSVVLAGGAGISLDGLKNLKDIISIQQKVFDVGNLIISNFIELGIGTKEELYNDVFVNETIKIKKEVQKKDYSFNNKNLEDIKELYSINDEDFIRMKTIVKVKKTMGLSESYELSKEFENLCKKYNIGFWKRSELEVKIKKELN